jgi:hypothetical protein
MQHELCTLENRCLLTQDYYFVLPFSFLLFPFSLLTRTYFPIGLDTYWTVGIVVLYMFWTFYHRGRFVTEHFILLGVVIGFSVGPTAL